MPEKKQVSVSIPEREWDIVKREAEKVNKKPTRLVRDLILTLESVEMEAA